MKINGKSIAITAGLLVVAMLVLLIEVSMFISGPSRKYESDIAKQESAIRTTYRDIKDLNRHAFYYITYVGEDQENIVWFNEKGEAIQNRKKDTRRDEEVVALVQKKYRASDVKLSLGYGYNNPVYVISCNAGDILLDYDTLEEVYYLKAGEA